MKASLRGIALFILVLGFTTVIFRYFNSSQSSRPKPDAKYVFINLTNDHRFDDSVRLTILANQKRADVQNAVVIAKSVPQPETIESWSAALFKKLRLGQNTNGRAILYLFVPSESRLKIEVGYALEGVLPDATVKSLEEAAKSFTYANRLHDFWSDLINTLNVVVYNHQKSLPVDYHFENWSYQSGGAGLSSQNYEISIEQLLREFKKLPPGDKRFEPTQSARETLDLYLLSLSEGIGDVGLPLLSTGSRIYRQFSPMNKALLQRMSKMYGEAMPLQVAEEDGQFLAWFRPNHPVLPIFLFRVPDGTWRVHEPYSMSIFNRFEDSMSIFQTHPLVPSAKVFTRTGLGSNVINWGAAPYNPTPADGDDFIIKLNELEEQARDGRAESLFALADMYLFEMWHYERALEIYRQGLALSERPEYLWRTTTPLIVSGQVKDFVTTYKRLSELLPQDTRLKKSHEFYKSTFEFSSDQWISEL
jgi:hypothetical protein